MDRATTLEHLHRHIEKGERLIALQRKTLSELEHGGHDTADARQLLRQFQDLQALHVADRPGLSGS
jgi:hypothetical protein